MNPEDEVIGPGLLKLLRALGAKRIGHEIANRREHAGYQLSFFYPFAGRRDVLQHRTGFALDKNDLLHLITEITQQDDLAERFAGAAGLEAPLQALPGKAAFQGKVDGFGHAAERAGDRLANGVADQGSERGGENSGILGDRDL